MGVIELTVALNFVFDQPEVRRKQDSNVPAVCHLRTQLNGLLCMRDVPYVTYTNKIKGTNDKK